MKSFFLLLVVGALSVLTACSDPPAEGGTDAGTDASRDGGGSDASLDMGRRDMGSSCLTGTHLCGTTCINDRSNDPSIGCALGCEGPCPDGPAHSIASCNEDGECDFQCESPWVREFAECVCTPVTCETLHATCGAPDNGCGVPLSCGTCGTNEMCVEGACSCSPDPNEPNNTAGTARAIGSFNDADDEERTFTNSNIHASTDGDWFSFQVTDGNDFGDPHITVRLDSIPIGSNYDMELYFACDPGGDASTIEDCTAFSDGLGHDGCASRNSGTTREIATIIAHCSTSSENGTALVHVIPSTWVNTCNNYSLNVFVH